MRIYISADMEGVTGLVDADDVQPGGRDYERGRSMMAKDVNAAIRGALAAGAADITVNDVTDRCATSFRRPCTRRPASSAASPSTCSCSKVSRPSTTPWSASAIAGWRTRGAEPQLHGPRDRRHAAGRPAGG